MRARNSDPDTSHAAAASANYDGVSGAIEKALLAVGTHGYITHELETVLNIQLVSVSPCMKPMEIEKRVCRTLRRRAHPGSNRKSIVWVARCFATDAEREASDALYALKEAA